MHEIASAAVTPELKALLHTGEPTVIRACAVLAGCNAGRIFVDDVVPPRYAFVWEADDGTLYRGGLFTPAVLAEAMALLRSERLVALAFREGDPCVELFPPEPSAGADALEYDRPIGASDLSPWLGDLPAGYEVRRMDEALWARSPKRGEDHGRYAGMRSFLEHGLAACITCGGETACEAYADMQVDGVREIGIFTEGPHRGRGLASIACAHLIRWCEQEGCATYWDCAATNTASRALARKLGFQNERPYKLLAWFGPSFSLRNGGAA
jgi:RimJ/RimL family protein N-acetyltransferase